MLKELNVDQVRFVALLAKAARAQRDDLLGNVAEDDLADVKAARGEHNLPPHWDLIRFARTRHKRRRCTTRLSASRRWRVPSYTR